MKIGGASGMNDPGGTYDKKMIEQTVDWVVKTVPIHCAISSAFFSVLCCALIKRLFGGSSPIQTVS
ncbi:hypothetical protein [Roseobacter litoralis]|uniref:hypothetical protein n=1 Tax=Roseobacter litoralis TaxID=42443 RepID=UPI002494951C|nr:hypothetical protein [Roseobacter litoralis]